MKSLVSIIIPAYNAKKYIKETINSVLSQTYQNWELIIVNDGSTDNTQYEIDKFVQLDSRIFSISKKNTGVSDSRNVGAKVAKGKYLCFLDADDIFLPENLEQKKLFLETNTKIKIVHSDVMLIDENSISTNKILKGKRGNILNSLLLWDGDNIPATSSIMIERDFFFKIGAWDTSFSTAADQDLFFRAAAQSEVGRLEIPLTQYRILQESMSRNIALMEKDHIAVYKKAAKNKLFRSFLFKQKCFSNLYLIIGGSWWKNGNNKIRGMYFIIQSIINYPPNLAKLIKKYGNK